MMVSDVMLGVERGERRGTLLLTPRSTPKLPACAEFRELWHQQKVPDAVDLARSLEAGKSESLILESIVLIQDLTFRFFFSLSALQTD